MKLLGRDADLRAETKLAAVGEACGGVYVNGCGVYLVGELLRRLVAFRYNGFAVACAVLCDVCDRIVDRVDDLYGKNVVTVLGVPVVLCSCFYAAEDSRRAFAAAERYVLLVELCLDRGQRFLGDVLMDEDSLDSVADRRS